MIIIVTLSCQRVADVVNGTIREPAQTTKARAVSVHMAATELALDIRLVTKLPYIFSIDTDWPRGFVHHLIHTVSTTLKPIRRL